MFVRTPAQRGLFETESLLSAQARSMLKASWAEQFAKRVLPLLLKREADLEGLYADCGRPNWSAARMMGLCILREMTGLGSDRETVESLAFDARFQHALGLEPANAVLSRRSLVDFRRRLASFDPSGELTERVFDDIARSAIEDLGLSVTTQRCDATFVMSNIALRGRTALLAEALERLLAALSAAGLLERVPAQVRAGFEEREGWESRLSFAEVAGGLHDVLRLFKNDPSVCALDAYQVAARVFSDHVRLSAAVVPATATDEPDDDPDDEPPKASRARKTRSAKAKAKTKAQRKARKAARQRSKGQQSQQPSTRAAEHDGACADDDTDENAKDEIDDRVALAEASAATEIDAPSSELVFKASTEAGVPRLQSLHDRDARRGHKGTGYHAQITETSGNKDRPEIITSVDVVTANTSDLNCVAPILESLERKDVKPEVMLVDAGYSSSDTLVHAAEQRVELLGPARTPTRKTELTREDFTFDDDGQTTACPKGHAPLRQIRLKTSMHKDPQPHAFFDGETCRVCPDREQCPVVDRPTQNVTRVCVATGLRLRDERLKHQKTPEFQAVYRPRSGIEATNSELKRAHRLGRLTVRGLAKVRQRTVLKATGCNVKRWTRFRARELPPTQQEARAAA